MYHHPRSSSGTSSSGMHGPTGIVPRILEPLPDTATTSFRSSHTGHTNGGHGGVHFFPGDIYTTFQTTISTPVQVAAATGTGSTGNHLALPGAYSPWNVRPKIRPARSTNFQQRKYPALTFTHPTGTSSGGRQFFRPVNHHYPAAVSSTSNGYLARPAGVIGFRSTNSTPPVPAGQAVGGDHNSSLVNPFLLVSPESQTAYSQRRHSTPGASFGIAPYFVDLHVGTGSAVQVHNGPETHIISGPASVTIMSNCQNPPTAIPVTVPPGQYVQQLIDDQGVLRSVFISNQPYAEGSLDSFQHSYYVPAQMQLQMPIHNTGTFPAQFPVPHPTIPISNGMQQQPPQPQNGFPQQPSPYASQEFHGFSQSHPQQPHPQQQQQLLDNRDYAARQKLRRKFDNKKRPPFNVTSREGALREGGASREGGVSRGFLLEGENGNEEKKQNGSFLQQSSNSFVKNSNNNFSQKNGEMSQQFENGRGDGELHRRGVSVSPSVSSNVSNGNGGAGGGGGPGGLRGVETEDDVLVAFFSTIQPVTVENIKANSVTITCTPLDVSLLDVSLLEKEEMKECQWEYFVLCGEGKEKQRIFTAGTAPQLTLQLVELRPNTEYLVCAQVGYGDLRGKQSESVTFRTAKAPPEPPEAPRLISRTKNTLSLKWHASRCDNGAKILRYVVQYDEGKNDGEEKNFVECFSGNEKQFRLSKLQPEKTFRFRLFAENEIGKSLFSPSVSFSTAGLPPAQPEPPVAVEVSSHEISFQWEKRPSDESFILQLEDPSSGHGFLPAYTGHDTFCTCKELNRMTDYKVRLAAENTEGTSVFSNVVSVTTRPEVPRPPSKPFCKTKVLPHSFRAQWDPPADTGGEAITEFVVSCTGTDGFRLDHTGPDTFLLVKAVEPGQTYFVRVHACNSAGMGQPSEVCMIHTPPVAPGAPLSPSVVGKPKATGVTLHWEPPVFTGGESIANYELKKIMFYEGFSPENDGVVVYYGPAKENHVEGLSPGKIYLFLIRAYNNVGPGPWSDVTQVETSAGPPDAPETLRLQAKNAHNILASWKEAWPNGAPITEYKLEMAEMEEADEQSFLTVYTGSKLMHEVKNLQPNAEYFFRLSATNQAGNSLPSPLYSCWTPPAPPSQVEARSVTSLVSPTAITLSWETPFDNGSLVVGYKIECDGQLTLVEQPVTQCLLDGLRPDTVYKIRIQATNGIGDGPFSNIVKVKTKPVVPDVPKLEVQTATHSTVKVKWSSVVKTASDVEYVLEMAFNKKDVFQTVYRGNQTSHKLNKVREDTLYFFRVRAVNEAGDSPQSDIVDCRTLKSPPPPVKAPKVLPSEDFCLIQWPKLPQCEGEDISYVLQSSKSGGLFSEIYKGAECQFKCSKLEPGTAYQFRVKPVRVLSDAGGKDVRSIPGAWSPLASYTPSLPSSSDVIATPLEVKQSSTRTTFLHRLRSIDFGDERVAILVAGACVLVCVVLISSYILLSN